MVTVARLSADLYANTSKFEGGLKRANQAMAQSKNIWSSALGGAGKNFDTLSKQVDMSTMSVINLKSNIGGLATTIGSALSAQKVIEYSDKWKNLTGRLAIVSDGMEDVANNQERLFAIAQRTGTPLEANATLYTRLNQSLKDYQKAQFDTFKVTELFSKALAITGESAASANGAVIQFTQGLGGDFKSAGQEINSLIEQAPRVAKAAADGLGLTVAQLKKLAGEGGLSTDKFLTAFLSQTQAIDAEFANLPNTVGKALTRLDNAFLKYIGQSDLVSTGTSSLAAAINALADSFDTIATVAGGAALLVMARMASQFLISTAAANANSIAQIANAAAIQKATAAIGLNARMQAAMAKAQAAAIGTTAAGTVVVNRFGTAVVAQSTALGTLALASRTAGAALLGAFGGPIGLAITAVGAAIYGVSKYAISSGEAMQRYREASGQLLDIQNQLSTASGKYIGQLKEQQIEIIKTAEAEIKRTQNMIKMKTIMAAALGPAGGLLNTESDRKTLAEQYEQLNQLLDTINKGMNAPLGGTGSNVLGGGEGGSDKSQKRIQDILDGLKSESDELRIQVEMYGQKESAISRAQKQMQIQNQLAAQGITLTQQQREQMDAYLDQIERQSDAYNRMEEQTKQQEEADKRRLQAMENLAASVESRFEDAIIDGGKLSDVTMGLAEDFARLWIRARVTQPLFAAALGTGSSDGGFLSGIGDFLFGPSGSFSTGIGYVPKDMTARLHRGESVMTAQETAAMRNGGGGVQVNIINNSPAQVSTASTDNGNGINLDVMIDQSVADQVNRQGSRMDQALSARARKTLIRR